jgi:hypothetical protein
MISPLPFAGLAVAALLAASLPAAAKEPPACAALSFRPLAAGLPDGDQQAGLYHSRFARIAVIGTVKGGAAVDYFMTLDGKKPDGAATVPKAAESCLKAKHIDVPAKPVDGACTGTAFRVVIDRVGTTRTIMLFGQSGTDWKLCSVA